MSDFLGGFLLLTGVGNVEGCFNVSLECIIGTGFKSHLNLFLFPRIINLSSK